MTPTTPNAQALLQRAQLQQQAARYKLLRQTAEGKLVKSIANSK